jgi:1-acyl-sn-glycerol-3-phosphate acyltransferase
MGWWSAKLLRILNVTSTLEGPGTALDPAGAMIAANHISWLDIFLISGVHPTRFVAKGEIRDWPIAGWIADKAGTLFIRREQWRDAARINELVHAALVQGDCVGLFPEGLTTEGDKLLKFHSALLASAVANRARVYPVGIRYEHPDGTLCREVSIRGDRSFRESLALVIRTRAVKARLLVAPAIATEGSTRREVAAGAEAAIASLLGLETAGREPGRAGGPQGAPR